MLRRSLLVLIALVAVFCVARGLRVAFFADIVPVAYAEEPRSLWAVEAAFMLQALEYISAAAAAIVLVIIIAIRVQRRAGSLGRPGD